ncbi:MAG: right-handed parallel beta-helix repeat-containing protein, partial [Methanobacteriota archaeon]
MNRKKMSLIIACLVVISTEVLTLTLIPTHGRATTLYVGGIGPGNYTNIQDAVDDAHSGDTIYVYSGFYHEHVRVNKTLSLLGEDRDGTIISGDGIGDVVNVTADWANITGFTIEEGGLGWMDAEIKLYGVHNCTVSNTIISSSLAIGGSGISLMLSNNNTILDNGIPQNQFGIFLHSSHGNTIVGNYMSRNYIGIHIYSSKGNFLADNVMTE